MRPATTNSLVTMAKMPRAITYTARGMYSSWFCTDVARTWTCVRAAAGGLRSADQRVQRRVGDRLQGGPVGATLPGHAHPADHRVQVARQRVRVTPRRDLAGPLGGCD